MEKIFIEVFHLSIRAGYLILAVIFVRFLLKKAPKNMFCFLWLLVGVRLLVPFSIESAFSLVPEQKSVREQFSNKAVSTFFSEMLPTESLKHTNKIRIQQADENEIKLLEKEDKISSVILFCTFVWLIGMIIMFGYFSISYFQMARRIQMAIPEEVNGKKVYRCGEISSPFLFGIFQPRIYVPIEISKEDLLYVVWHEMSHKKRKDYLWKPIFFLILTVYWFQPLVWAAYLLFCRDIEFACDEKVIQELGFDCKKTYSQVLLNCSVERNYLLTCPLAFGAVGVKQRIYSILRYKKPSVRMIVMMAMLILIISVCFMTQKKSVQGIDQTEWTEAEHLKADELVQNGIYQWRKAFEERDEKTILKMADEETIKCLERQGLLWKKDGRENETMVFGYSSPWPMWEGEQDQILEFGENTAKIIYYAWTSEPHITVWIETLTYRIEENQFLVTSEKLEQFWEIASTKDFFTAYPDGIISGTMMDYQSNGMGEVLNRNAIESPSQYNKLFTPDTASAYLLNLESNENITEFRVEMDEEARCAWVTVQFVQSDGGSIKIKMIQPYGENGIWIVQDIFTV